MSLCVCVFWCSGSVEDGSSRFLSLVSQCLHRSPLAPPLPASFSSAAPRYHDASKVKLKRILDMLKDRITSEAFETECERLRRV